MGELLVGSVRTESGSEGRICSEKEKVRVLFGSDVEIARGSKRGTVCGKLLIIPEHCLRRCTQTHGGIFHTLLPFFIIKEETGSECIGSLRIEMVLRNLVVGITDVRHGLVDVPLDLFIDLGDGSTGIYRCERGFRLLHVGDTQILAAGGRIVVHREDVHKDEVAVGTAHESLGSLLTERSRPLAAVLLDKSLDGLKGMVGR